MIKRDYLKIGEEIIERACRSSREEAEVYIKRLRAMEFDISEKKLEKFNTPFSFGIGLRFFSENRMGFAYTTGFEQKSIEMLVQQARANAKNGAVDECNRLPEVDCKKKWNRLLSQDLYDEDLKKISVKMRLEKIREMEDIAIAYDKKIRKVFKAFYAESQDETFIFNSRGFKANYRSAQCSAGLIAVAGAGTSLEKENKEIQLGSDFTVKRRFRELRFRELAENAARRAISLLGARRVKTQETSVIIEPIVFSGFLHLISSGLGGDSVQKKKSPFGGKKRMKIASEIVNIIDDGILPQGIATSPFDDEGIPRQRNILVKDGILSTFLYDSYTARKDKIESTGNASRSSFRSLPSVGVTNFFLEKGRAKREELIESTDRGLYVMETMGMHTADPISGDFSVGVSGLWIERGKFTFPVHGVMLAGNILELLNSIEAIADDLGFYGNFGSPTIKASNILISGE